MKAGTPDLVKFRTLKRRLGEPTYVVVGVLESLWLFTASNAKLGDVGRFTDEEIAAWIDWIGDCDELVEALVACGWLRESEEHRLVVTDWHEHCPTYIKGNAAQRLDKKAYAEWVKEGLPYSDPLRTTPKVGAKGQSSSARAKEKGPSLRAPVPSQVKSSQAKPSQVSDEGLFSEKTTGSKNNPSKTGDEKPTQDLSDWDPPDEDEPDDPPPKPERRRYSESFEEFWQAWPSGKRKTKKPDAAKAWAVEVERPRLDPAPIIEAVREFAKSPEGKGDYCPGPGPWIRGRRWEDDRKSWYARQTQETVADRNQAVLKESLDVGDDYISLPDQLRAIAAKRRAEAERTVDVKPDARIGGGE